MLISLFVGLYYNTKENNQDKVIRILKSSLVISLANLDYFECETDTTKKRSYLTTADALLEVAENICTVYKDELIGKYGEPKTNRIIQSIKDIRNNIYKYLKGTEGSEVLRGDSKEYLKLILVQN